MESLALGLTAALAWGVHDIFVRFVSRSLGILESLIGVLIFGLLAQIILAVFIADLSDIDTRAIWLSVASGVCFCMAGVGHYNAFAKGPVRIVAPLIGTYSVLSFIIASILGAPITILQWTAVLGLVVGIALIARASEEQKNDAPVENILEVVGYCIMAMIGFATTVAFGQQAAASADPLTAGLITRAVTIVCTVALLIFFVKEKTPLTVIKTPKALMALALTGVLDAIALGSILLAGTVPRPEFATASSSIFGLVTVFIAWLFLKERINAIQWCGTLVIFAGIAILAASSN